MMPSTMRLISKTTLASDQASVTFSGIPQTFTDLYVVASARSSRPSFNSDAIYISLNGSTANFSARWIQSAGGSISGGTETRYAGNATAATAGANEFGSTEIYVPNYAGAANKTISTMGIGPVGTGTPLMATTAVLWSNTAPITSLSLSPAIGPNFTSGSSFFLYGITSAAGSIPGVFGVDATGGDVAISGGFKYHVFRSSGMFTVAQPGWAEVLVIGGGGSGGVSYAGGGGAGGVVASNRFMTPGSLPVLVGAGGAAVTALGSGITGSSSDFAGMNALGGGGAGHWNTTGFNGLNGGSGGGGGMGTSAGNTTSGGSALQTSPSGAVGYGNNGGGGLRGSGIMYLGGGGGGAGATGGSASGTTAGSGGAGLGTWSAWATATGTGVSGFYAGGGGGGAEGGTRGSGGSGGGGLGGLWGTANDGAAGAANTGSGGGGGAGNLGWGGAGGSGIVIVRYPVT